MMRLPFMLIVIFVACACAKKSGQAVAGGKDSSGVTVGPNPVYSPMYGVNWADSMDNFKDGFVVPTGLVASDSYEITAAKSDNILSAFRQRGANTVRLPINPPSVLQSWWASYRAAIDKASARGMKVILACWEAASSKDGRVDDMTAFWNMWRKVVNQYARDSNVYFEVFNEPHGYNLTDLNNLYAQWLSNYPAVPHGRVLLDGAGYAQDVNGVGADSRLGDCLLSYHNYTWFDNNKTTIFDWEGAILSINYPARTVITEFGIPMTSGKNYIAPPGTDREIAYFEGITSQVRASGIGSIYWPGLRVGDSYSLLTLHGTTVTNNNAAGLTRLQFGWKMNDLTPFYASFDSTASFRITSRSSNKSLDVNGSSTSDGGGIIQWDFWGGNNQQWLFAGLGNGYFTIMNRNSGKVLDISNSVAERGASVVQWTSNGTVSQQWQITDIGFGYYKIINRKSGFSLDVNGASTINGAQTIQWSLNGGKNQQWQIVKL